MEQKRKIEELYAHMERGNREYDQILEEYFKLMKMNKENFQTIIKNQVKYFTKTAEGYFKDQLENFYTRKI